MAALQKRAALP